MFAEHENKQHTYILSSIERWQPSLAVERIGDRPTVMFVSGIHGDERNIIQPLRDILAEKTRNGDAFCSHVRALEAHPHALALGKRKVADVDLNRQFLEKPMPDHPQAKLLAECLYQAPDVHTIFSFHEDVAEDRFSFYHQTNKPDERGIDPDIEALKNSLIAKVTAIGVSLYQGIDDPELGNIVTDGFCHVPMDIPHDNTFEMWALKKDLHNHPSMTRVVLFEIPGSVSQEKKQELILLIFDHFIGPYLAKFGKKNVT